MTNLRLPGQYDERLLASVGLQGPYYNWNRWYLPGLGRYLEPDPIAMAGSFNAEFGVSWYSYADGNPVSNTDPRGLDRYLSCEEQCGRIKDEDSKSKCTDKCKKLVDNMCKDPCKAQECCRLDYLTCKDDERKKVKDRGGSLPPYEEDQGTEVYCLAKLLYCQGKGPAPFP